MGNDGFKPEKFRSSFGYPLSLPYKKTCRFLICKQVFSLFIQLNQFSEVLWKEESVFLRTS